MQVVVFVAYKRCVFVTLFSFFILLSNEIGKRPILKYGSCPFSITRASECRSTFSSFGNDPFNFRTDVIFFYWIENFTCCITFYFIFSKSFSLFYIFHGLQLFHTFPSFLLMFISTQPTIIFQPIIWRPKVQLLE